MNLLRLLVLSCFLISCGGSSENGLDKESLLEKGEEMKSKRKAETAIEYNDGIVGLQGQIINQMLRVMKLEAEDPVKEMEGLINTIEESKEALNNLETYEGGEEMKQTALDLFGFYEKACKGPWIKAFRIYKENKGNMMEDQEQEFISLLEQGGEGEQKYDDAFEKAQNEFAAMHGFVIGGNVLQDEIDNAGK